jgi:phage tail-like protein
MAIFPANPGRPDPYKNFKFRLKWDGQYVAGMSKVGTLKETMGVVKHRSGGDPSASQESRAPQRYDPITLERGLTLDKNFHDWAGLVWNRGSDLESEVSLANLYKDIYLELYNESGQLAMAYTIYRCWVSEYQTAPHLEADPNAIAIQHIKLENQGWERDTSVTEPTDRL